MTSTSYVDLLSKKTGITQPKHDKNNHYLKHDDIRQN